MSGLEFTALIVDALAWPIAAVIVAVLFRKQLRALLEGPLSRLRAGPLEVEWDRRLSEAERDLGLPDDRALSGPTVDELAPLAEQSPQAAVLAGFAKLEANLRKLVASKAPEKAAERSGAVELARAAHELDLIPETTVLSIESLAAVRNLAAHGRFASLDPKRAVDYLALVDGVQVVLGLPPT